MGEIELLCKIVHVFALNRVCSCLVLSKGAVCDCKLMDYQLLRGISHKIYFYF